jgi:hypothetical protein
MSNLIQQKTTFATDAQHASTPHQRTFRETFAKRISPPAQNDRSSYVCRLVTARTMEKHRTYGTGPVYRKLGNRVVYAIKDLDVWAAQGI